MGMRFYKFLHKRAGASGCATSIAKRPTSKISSVGIGARPHSASHSRHVHPPGHDATSTIVAEHRHPGVDDLQSSSSVGATGGEVECNSTIPGDRPEGLNPSVGMAREATCDPGERRGTPTSRDRRLAVVVFRRCDGR
jgi:hypothetical protein